MSPHAAQRASAADGGVSGSSHSYVGVSMTSKSREERGVGESRGADVLAGRQGGL